MLRILAVLLGLAIAGCATSPPKQVTADEASHLAENWVRTHNRGWKRYHGGEPTLETGPHGNSAWTILYTPKSDFQVVGDHFTVSIDAVTRHITWMGGM